MEKSASPISTEEMLSKRKISCEVPIDNNKQPEDETKAEETEASNGKPNNKIMKFSELTNMDPLDYFTRFLDIPELFFQHLRGKEVLVASEVSPSYYNFIASSKVLMQKIKVVLDRDLDFNGEELVRHSDAFMSHFYYTTSLDPMEIKVVFRDKTANQLGDFNLLKNSRRLYQNIEVRRSDRAIQNQNGSRRTIVDYLTDSELEFFYSKAHEWKNVTLDNVHFRKKLDLWRLLSAIESSVESINVWEFGFLLLEDPSSEIESFEAFTFPKLKQLRVSLRESKSFANGFSKTLIRFLLNSVAIEELYLCDYSGEVFSKDILTKMLQNFNTLTSVSIYIPLRDQIFEDDSWENFNFKLKELSMVEHLNNYLSFLKSQSDHLEKLWTKVENRETFDVVMKMPKLKSLGVMFLKDFSENEVPNKISTSITQLDVYNYAKVNNLKYLLDSTPKVIDLKLDSIDENDFKMLKSMKKKFEKLKVTTLKDVDRKEMEEIMTENYTSLEIFKSI